MGNFRGSNYTFLFLLLLVESILTGENLLPLEESSNNSPLGIQSKKGYYLQYQFSQYWKSSYWCFQISKDTMYEKTKFIGILFRSLGSSTKLVTKSKYVFCNIISQFNSVKDMHLIKTIVLNIFLLHLSLIKYKESGTVINISRIEKGIFKVLLIMSYHYLSDFCFLWENLTIFSLYISKQSNNPVSVWSFFVNPLYLCSPVIYHSDF